MVSTLGLECCDEVVHVLRVPLEGGCQILIPFVLAICDKSWVRVPIVHAASITQMFQNVILSLLPGV